MPKLVGVRERIHQPFWDTIIRSDEGTSPTPALINSMNLFNGTNLGQDAWTNMKAAGTFPSDSTYIILAMRSYSAFRSAAGNPVAIGPLYQAVQDQLFLSLIVGDKPQFKGQGWYFPAGGGLFGFDNTAAGQVFSNGHPSANAILKFAKPIPIPARQSFNVKADFVPMGPTNIVDVLNGQAFVRDMKVVLDGLFTRDVQ